MKKRILSVLLTLALCLSLLPAAALAVDRDGIKEVPGLVTGPDAALSILGIAYVGDLGTISPQEAASGYGISVSTSHVDFGTHYMQYGAWPITQTITITNNGAYQIGYDYSCGPYYEDKYVLEIHHPGLVEPGESGEGDHGIPLAQERGLRPRDGGRQVRTVRLPQ